MTSIHARLRCLLRALCLCVLSATAPCVYAQGTAFTTDPSDIWWKSSESGWGMQIVAEGDAAFATLFVYDADRQPTFYTSTLSLAGGANWSGDLYRTSGPYFGASSFDPAAVTLRKVGTLTFARTGSDSATLEYSVDGVTVRKDITRQLLRYENYSGTYATIVHLSVARCSNAADNREQTDPYTIDVNQSGTTMTIKGTFAHRAACTYTGSYTQSGKVGAVGASYVCADGDQGAMNFFELTRRPGMISGRLSGHSITDACDYSGTFTGLLPF